MWRLRTLFVVVLWSNNALDGILQDEVCHLVTSDQCADQCASVYRDDTYFLCILSVTIQGEIEEQPTVGVLAKRHIVELFVGGA